MVFLYLEEGVRISLENYTLILPSISVGNVGQLAVDLLLNNLEVKPVAYVHHPCFLPIVGADPFDPQSTRMATSCQLFECKDKQLAILQNRSPLIPGKVAEYRTFLVNFIKEQKIKRTVLLCSSFSQFFTIEDIRGVPMHYLSSSSLSSEEFSSFNWKKFSLPDKVDPNETVPIPGGGIAKSFLEDCEREGIPLAVLILVCSEGDNYPEAFQMVERLNEWLNLIQVDSTNKWKMPISWTLPYGSGAPKTVY
ncbi:hypothetical protein JTE90_005909 [Oedothorax gibbosus]|uniref:Proteasome assembly chaperone 2 n=1 Tax=Oedothorax gibbosus TaxID=931172 RepID=A0AAV6U8D0_9ARAC|nr:hypothetical protein JTE90_005909 [Oedothorax gibbosus]